jgi:shikimate dehydrogenase
MKDNKAFRLGLLGHPVSHSKSPDIFTQFFVTAGIQNGAYELLDLPNIEDFPSFIREKINEEIPLKGFNVTVPHKVSIMSYLDTISAEARAVGAVNTVLVKGNPNHFSLHGHNTDVAGFAKSLQVANQSGSHNITNAIIFGNGGSAQAVKFALSQSNIPFHIWHRNRWITPSSNHENSLEHIQSYTLFVHTTPLGMWPNDNSCIDWPWETLQSSHRLIDLVYNPEVTHLMQKFAARNAFVMNGKHMLQQQAVEAWALFQDNLSEEEFL